MLYRVFVPKQAVGANLVYFDLFAPSTTQFQFELVSCRPVVSGAVAVVGTLGIDLHLTRTTAVGTGGTAMTFGGTALDAMTCNPHDNLQILPVTDISGRLTPTGGATAGQSLSWLCVFGEETNNAAYTPASDLARPCGDVSGVIIPKGTGIRVVQGAVAATGNVGFNLLLRAVRTA